MVVLDEDGNERRCFLDEVPAGSVGGQRRSFHPLRASGGGARAIWATLSVLVTQTVSLFTSSAIQGTPSSMTLGTRDFYGVMLPG